MPMTRSAIYARFPNAAIANCAISLSGSWRTPISISQAPGSRSEIGDWLSLLLSLSIQEGAVMPNAPLAGSPQGAHLVMASYLRGQRLCYPQTISGPCPTSRSAGLVAAAGLGQATADQVTDGQQGDQEPALVGAEPLTVRGDVDRPGGDQDTEN